jgi:hypothetical protein
MVIRQEKDGFTENQNVKTWVEEATWWWSIQILAWVNSYQITINCIISTLSLMLDYFIDIIAQTRVSSC